MQFYQTLSALNEKRNPAEGAQAIVLAARIANPNRVSQKQIDLDLAAGRPMSKWLPNYMQRQITGSVLDPQQWDNIMQGATDMYKTHRASIEQAKQAAAKQLSNRGIDPTAFIDPKYGSVPEGPATQPQAGGEDPDIAEAKLRGLII